MAIQQIEWANYYGQSVMLHGGDGIVVERGVTGLDMPPTEIETTTAIGLDGEVAIGSKVLAREISIPIRINAQTEDEFHARYVELVRNCWAAAEADDAATGTLYVTSPNGGRRGLLATFAGGLEGDESFETRGDRWFKAILRFRSTHPYWGGVIRRVTFTSNSQAPFFPMRLGDDAIRLNPDATFGTYVAPDLGDAPVWPTWNLYGPFEGFTVTVRNPFGSIAGHNLYTSRYFQFSGSVPSGGSVGLQMAPWGDGGGSNLRVNNVPVGNPVRDDPWSCVVWPSDFWSMATQGAEVSVQVSGSGPATRAEMAYQTMHLTWRG